MSASETNSTLKVVKIDVLDVGEVDGEGFEAEIIKIINKEYEGNLKTNRSIEIHTDTNKCNLVGNKSERFIVLKSTIVYEEEYELENVIKEDLQYYDFPSILSSSLPMNLSTTFTILIPAIKNGENASSMIEKFSVQLEKPREGVGLVRGFVLSILDSVEDVGLSERSYLIPRPFPSERIDEHRMEEIIGVIESIAVHTAELSELFKRSKNFFSVLKDGESEIGERVEDYLWKLLGPEPIELEVLESWLSYIMERESTVSTMIGKLSIAHMEAKSIAVKIDNLFNRLNERSFKDYPQNLELELEKYREVVRLFEKYIVRGEALKSRLETVMKEVRTYLSLQQQKIAIEEQKSSREQLVRLVNLQEIFHKVEIFIVAVYITEMAHIVFEVLIHEFANLLTAIFIPVALILAIGVSRILHKE